MHKRLRYLRCCCMQHFVRGTLRQGRRRPGYRNRGARPRITPRLADALNEGDGFSTRHSSEQREHGYRYYMYHKQQFRGSGTVLQVEADLNDVPAGTTNELQQNDLKWRCLFDYSTSISLLWIACRHMMKKGCRKSRNSYVVATLLEYMYTHTCT